MATPPEPPDVGGGNVLTQRIGPLATWVWLLIATIAVLVFVFLRKGKSTATTTGQATAGQSTAAQNVPDIIIQNNEPAEPAEPIPPGAVPPSAPAPPTTTPPVKTKGPSGPPVTRPPVPPKKQPAPQYTTVTVARWTDKNTPWNSTLSGIAEHYHVKGGYQALAKLNGIKNANLITPGQKIKVPK